MGTDIRGNPHIAFDKLEMTHFLSWSLIPGTRDELGREGAARLAFEGNFEGSTNAFLNELYEQAGGTLKEKIYRHCGLPPRSDVEGFKEFLLAHAVKAALPYEGYSGLSACKIQNDARVRRRFLQLFREAPATRPVLSTIARAQGSEAVRLNQEIEDCYAIISRELQEAARNQGVARNPPGVSGVESAAKDEPPLEFDAEPEPWRLRLRKWGPVRLLLSSLAFPALGVGALLLGHEVLSASWEEWRARRRKGPSQPETPGPMALTQEQRHKLDQIQDWEDYQTQNHLTHFVELKPGLLRLPVLRLMLWGWKHLAKYYFTDGNLGSIEGIHRARWVIIDGGRQEWPPPKEDGRPRWLRISRKRHCLLFFSNYDGSWESYLDDFIDRASLGLTTIWCNTVGFPKPRIRWFPSKGRLPLAIELGADREDEFKRWVREHQIRTLTWYSKHPDKSVSNIRTNRELRARAGVPLPVVKRMQWLQLLS
ncbi:hypothetical protein DAT35_18665 [Vitiosangium sp. GDMCC 1.1324]|nr:hypothetical protein DAT35_18665 [Vitiosangium sp. GDMCC 1.1324]